MQHLHGAVLLLILANGLSIKDINLKFLLKKGKYLLKTKDVLLCSVTCINKDSPEGILHSWLNVTGDAVLACNVS